MAPTVGTLRRLLRGALLAAALLAVCLGPAFAVTPSNVRSPLPNAASPLGINLATVTSASSEQPFLNVLKMNGGWRTADSYGHDTGEEKYLHLDSNGWPISLEAINDPKPQKFTEVMLLMLGPSPNTPNGPYPSGQYVVRYRGRGTIKYSFDAIKDPSLSRPGRDVIAVTPAPGGGIRLEITSTDPNHAGNYIRDIQVVGADEEQALLTGRVFNPKFLRILQNFRVLRFMDWFHTNGSTMTAWRQRVLPSYFAWGTNAGVPYEVSIKLANTLSADPWINVPAMADDDYIKQLATLVHNDLGSEQKVYVEYTNEGWNTSSQQGVWIAAQAQSSFPSAPDWQRPRIWFGVRTAQMCDIWKSVWKGDADRVVCVLGAQAATPWSATIALDCPGWSEAPCYKHGLGAVAVAPYFGDEGVPMSFASQPDGGLSRLFASLTSQTEAGVPAGGYLGEALARVRAYHSALAPYNLPLIAYEGGQSFVGLHSSVLTNLYIAANRDPRMGMAYTYYLGQWKADGGQLFVLYNDVGPGSQYGEWGALESIMQTASPLRSAPPKWQAIQDFISHNPCWWADCNASGGLVPSHRGHRF